MSEIALSTLGGGGWELAKLGGGDERQKLLWLHWGEGAGRKTALSTLGGGDGGADVLDNLWLTF